MEIKLCRFENGVCTVCGVQKSAGDLRNCPSKPWKYRTVPQKFIVPMRRAPAVGRKQTGLGDHTEILLKSIGVTPERYSEVKAKFGLAPTCACAKRKEWLNQVGRWLTG